MTQGRSLRQSMMTFLITNFLLTTTIKTVGVVRGRKKGMEEEAKQETNERETTTTTTDTTTTAAKKK